MARATGSRAKLYGQVEGVAYGTAATGNYNQLRFVSSDLGAEQPIQNDDILGTDRQPSDPSRGPITDAGNVVIPVDLRDFGWWLQLLLGAPSSSGDTDYTHVYTGASATLPSATIEIGHPGVPRYFLHTGCMMNSMQLSWSPDGQAQASCAMIAQGETDSGSSSAGTATTRDYVRFQQFQGFIKKDDVALGNITGLEVTIGNGMDAVRTIRPDGMIDGIDLGLLSVTGSLTARFADVTLLAAAQGDTPIDLEFGWSISATKSLLIETPEIHLSRAKAPLQGPGGVSIRFDFQAAEPSAANALTVTLKNDVASY